MKRDGWCLQTPSGKLLAFTFGSDENSCWDHAFTYLYDRTKWMEPFWKKWEESIEAAADHNYRMVPVRLVPVRVGKATTIRRKR